MLQMFRSVLIRATATTNSRRLSSVARSTAPEFYPNVLVLPVARKPLFPNTLRNLVVRDVRAISALQQLMASNQPYLGAFLTRDEDNEADMVNNKDDIYGIGVFCQLLQVQDVDDGSLQATVMPHRRIRLTDLRTPTITMADYATIDSTRATGTGGDKYDVMADESVSRGLVTNLYDEPGSRRNPVIKAITTEILSVIKDIIRYNPAVREQVALLSFMARSNLIEDPGTLADFAASLVPFGDPAELQAILESLVVEERLQKTLILLKKELANAKLQSQISAEVEEKMAKSRRDYYLIEHMKGIQKELGLESDGRDKLVDLFKERAQSLKMPESVQQAFKEELNKFKNLDASAQEFNHTRNYLDWLTTLPWGKRTQENFDLPRARQILDEDHYGMKDVKDRILEFIAVGKLKKSVQGKIVCLSGPPGVGKTSIGKSIARALDREFYRFSVGGLNDVSEIKGHRRTYVGAMPGKLVQAFKKVQSENPLILIDEVDKIGRNDYRGDPSSALLEVLDPEQNATFLDHYLDVPVDLSKTLFVCTANVLETIPGPLLDRMEVIELSGYVAEEKVAIAQRYLVPDAREAAGLKEDQVEVQSGALVKLITEYCRESGVRNLKKHVEKIFRRAALRIVRAQEQTQADEKVTVTEENLKDFVGNPVFTSEVLYDHPPPGVVMGLAYTGLGGTALYIESLLQRKLDTVPADSEKSKKSNMGRGHFMQTGQMGDVMRESTNIALTYAKTFLTQHQPQNDFFSRADIHLHVPQGAVKKDGPSAGITMCTSLLSLALGRPIASDIAMTGELTLTGRVLRIGGVKEKVIAAKRSGVKRILVPEANRGDWEDLDQGVKDGVEVGFVERYEDVAKVVFEGVPELKLS